MKIISHRGNLRGKSISKENSVLLINNALSYGLDVEIDVWFKDRKWYLGHDNPTHEINQKFLENKKLWCHAKNLDAFKLMLENKKIHCFWHEKDSFTLTSNKYIWTYPGSPTSEKSIIVLKNKNTKIPKNCFGICTDYPLFYLK